VLTQDHQKWGHAASTGLGFTHEAVVDAHFAACAEHYRALLDDVGIKPGWHVLDAGCGSGAFLPWLAGLVGPAGRLAGIDLAAENAARAAATMASSAVRCASVDVRQGDLLNLPYADGEFDAVWCANTAQYLDDDELARVLAEFRRVVRPGGLIAVKDIDAGLICVRPGDPFLFGDFFRRASQAPGYARQLLRGRDLYRLLSEAGLLAVRQRTELIEHHAPMAPEVLHFYALACARVAEQAVEAGVGGDWQPLLDPSDPGHPLRDRYGYVSEGNTLAVGTVPADPTP
jgi:ubiquinone/menaquinone biosynthesis C-methylase UbiE